MTERIAIFPWVGRFPFSQADWREQHARECAARCDALLAPPPRTRPLLVISNHSFRQVRGKMVATAGERITPDNFDFALASVAAEMDRGEG